MSLPLKFRSLTDVKATAAPSPSSSSSSAASLSSTNAAEASLRHVDSDFVVILAALLCALICILGLVAVARCAWIRRLAYISALPTTRPPPSGSVNKGLKKKALNSLPKLTYSPPSHAEGNGSGCGKFSVDCAICLAEFVSGDEIRLLPPCGHVFHVVCVDTWLKSHSSCPSCRVQILVAGNSTTKSTECQRCGDGELSPPASSSVAVDIPVAAPEGGNGIPATATATTPANSRQEEINIFLP
ncbi:OLC1v1016133C1 [Oldenlandia corymbosa var. corymbosa]|uniref:OLC1v1016133C1 n=1 Tax=Oldenlandia corymbosa var. corymbosa TaxID=529605 RepID=A0AAV1E6N9_OLDCO|nr:OLC1v1016133C1 [Oldenlandia corymbosa var. corymbosa]